MQPLRILHLNSMLTGGGTDDRSVRIAYALMRLGHSVWMAGPAGREFSKIVTDLGIPFEPLKSGPLKLGLILHTARLIRRERIQILHARHGRDYWPAILAARLSGIRPKVVLSRHLAKSPGSWASRHFLLGQCDAMAAVSHFVAKVLREGDADPESDNPERHYRAPMLGDYSKIHVVYGGFDMEHFKPGEALAQRQAWGLKPDDYAFAVVGGYSLPRGKGQREFLKAAAIVRSELPHARFLIIGRGNMKEVLESDIANLGLQGVAWLTPYCLDMPAAMNAIDCMVLSQVGTEAIPGVVCEAHACGKPVIASDLDGIPEAFAPGGCGQLVKRGSIEELATAMAAWGRRPPLDMPARWKLHSRVAERFSLERAALDLEELYRSLLP
jgi:glycosyltransferase involved in cell wall biosynthesis